MTLAELRTYVRDLTGIYSTDLLADTLLNRWLQESYTELNREQDWPWVVFTTSGTIATNATTVPLTGCSGRIKEFVIKYANGEMYQVASRRGLVQSEQGDDGFFYDFNTTTDTITLSKPMDAAVTFYVTYMKDVAALSAVNATASEMPAEFEAILAYRTAIKVLNAQSDDTKRAQAYFQEYLSLKDTLITELIVDEDIGPIQLAGSILRIDGRTIGRTNLRYRSL